MSIKGSEFARLMGVSPARVSQWRKAGMPTGSTQEAAAWVESNYGRSGGTPNFASTDSGGAAKIGKPTKRELKNHGIEGTHARARQMELDAFRLYQEGEESKASSTEMITRMRRWETATSIRIKAEKQITDLSVKQGHLVQLSEAQNLYDELILPLDKLLRTMPINLAHMVNPADPEFAEVVLQHWVDTVARKLRGEDPDAD